MDSSEKCFSIGTNWTSLLVHAGDDLLCDDKANEPITWRSKSQEPSPLSSQQNEHMSSNRVIGSSDYDKNLCKIKDFYENTNEPITSRSLFQEQTPFSSQILPCVSLNRVNQNPTGNLIESKKSTDYNKNLCEIKEFSDAIDSYFSSTDNDKDVVTQLTGDQSVGCSSSIPSLFKSSTCFNSFSFNSSTINHQYANTHHESINTSRRESLEIVEYPKDAESWIPNVAKKILSCYYSELHIKSEFLSTQIMLDSYESLVLKEAVEAFSGIALINANWGTDSALMPYEYYADPRPIELINSCEKLRSYRKLHIEDKMRLTQSAFFDLNCVKGMVTYDKTIDGWYWNGCILPRSFVDVTVHTPELENLVLNFPDCLRNDINIATLLYLIVLFNPDLPKLKFRNSIRQQQYIYIYLLKRYLVSLFGSTCEASEYHYASLAKLEQAMKIPDSAVFELIQSGSTKALSNHVIDLVKLTKCNHLKIPLHTETFGSINNYFSNSSVFEK